MDRVERKQLFFVWLTAIFVAALVTGDFIGGRFFVLFGFTFSAGIIPFPLTFVLTDVVNEFYGPSGARRLTFLGLGAAIFVWIVIQLALHLPPSPTSPISDEVFHAAFGTAARLYIASLCAYVIGQLLDISIFRALRKTTGHRLLWLRATGSTVLSQMIDSFTVSFVFLAGTKSLIHHRQRRQQLRRQADHGGAVDAGHLRHPRGLPAAASRRRTGRR